MISQIQTPAESWIVPLSHGDRLLGEAYEGLQRFGLKQDDVPFIIQLVENPKFQSRLRLFHGAAALKTHDCIHIVLGRGVLPKDEAFVIGFTMGSTEKVSTTEENLYAFIARHLYPEGYRFYDEEARIFRDAVKLGYVSDCQPLAEVDFGKFFHLPIAKVREELGIEEDLLRAYYRIEQKRFPNAVESQRLLN